MRVMLESRVFSEGVSCIARCPVGRTPGVSLEVRALPCPATHAPPDPSGESDTAVFFAALIHPFEPVIYCDDRSM